MNNANRDSSKSLADASIHSASRQQEGMWFVSQLEGASAAYNVPVAYLLRGSLDRAALKDSLNIITEQHTALRTQFVEIDGSLKQVVQSQVELDFEFLELKTGESVEEAKQIAAEFAAKPFDLSTAPLMRTLLLEVSEDQHLLLLSVHHIVFDGWSAFNLLRELSTIYNSRISGEELKISQKFQYIEFAAWQEEWLGSGRLEKQLAYWEKQLLEAPKALNLPFDAPRPAELSYSGEAIPFAICSEQMEQLQELAKANKVTLFSCMLALFQLFLAKYSAQSDIIVGSPFANRRTKEMFESIGYFTNVLALRTKFDADPSFNNLLEQVHDTVLDAQDNSDVTFNQVVRAVNPERDPAINPIFQVMFSFQADAKVKAEFKNLEYQAVEVGNGTSKFDLLLDLKERDGRIDAYLEFNSLVFERETAEKFVEHFNFLLSQALSFPERKVSELQVLCEDEQELILNKWNQTEQQLPKAECLHQLFEAQAAKTPDAIALIDGDERMTYGELDALANQLANYLLEKDLKVEDRVGIFLERTNQMVVALIGVLKAGGAYVPLDPSYPEERISYIIADADMPFVITQELLEDELPVESETTVVVIDGDWKSEGEFSSENPGVSVNGDNLVYVFYTSGSTGQPKGVALEHHSPVVLCEWAAEIFTAEETAGMLFSTSVSFDLSVFEVFFTLGVGGKVIVAENALELHSLPAANEVTFINTVPSIMQELLRTQSIPANVCVAALCGEPLSSKLADEIYAEAGVKRVIDFYGPSEDTTYSTFTVRTPGGPETIGKAIAESQAYVLDAQLRPVPLGVEGELCLSGKGLARGYLGKPELTAEKFVEHPFRAGEKMYRTGDLVRLLKNGDLQFLGRLDHQVKIRGFRIELGEIETFLLQHSSVEGAVVMARESATSGKQLVAYLTLNSSEELMNSELRRFLQKSLPDYMIPAAFVTMDSFPQTQNGKINRKALPEPSLLQADNSREFVAPSTETEKFIAELWCKALKLERVSVNDTFFDLGGHSLLALSVLVEISEKLKIELDPKEIILQTLAQFANSCDEKLGGHLPKISAAPA